MDTQIFTEPVFIRKNILVNFLHSNFATEELQLIPVFTFSSDLRETYHSLSLENEQAERQKSLALIYSILIHHFHILGDIDWFYLERIAIHYANFSRPISSRYLQLLNRR